MSKKKNKELYKYGFDDDQSYCDVYGHIIKGGQCDICKLGLSHIIKHGGLDDLCKKRSKIDDDDE